MVDCPCEPSNEGTTQRGPLFLLLGKLLLDDSDQELERRGVRFVRTAEDFLVFTQTEQPAAGDFHSLERNLARKLKLL